MAPTQLSGDLELFSKFDPEGKFNVLEHTKGKKVPSYLAAKDELKAAGIDEIMVYCVNDPAVMDAWAKDQKVVDTHVTFYSDPYGTFTKHFDMELTHPGPVGKGLVGRCKRFALYIDDGEVKYQALAEDPDFDPAGDDFPEKCMPVQMLAAIAKL